MSSPAAHQAAGRCADASRIVAILLVGASACATSCATILGRNTASAVDSPVYLGTRLDAEGLVMSLEAPFADDESSLATLFLPCFLIDLPLSLAADTLLLPLTIPEHYGSRRQAAKTLVAAIESGNLAEAQAVAQERPGLLRAKLYEGNTPLQLAVRREQPELVAWLATVEAGRGQTAEQREALRIAIETGNADLVRILLDRGLDSVGDDAFLAPLDLAVMNDKLAVADLLLERGAPLARPLGKTTPLHLAVSRDAAAMAELLIAHGADIDAHGYAGNTPLHDAARRGHLAVARVLVERGADVDVRNDAGKTPLDLVRSPGGAAIAELLRSRERSD